MYAAIPSAATLLGVAATYGARIFRSPPREVIQQEIGEFGFHNGILKPHRQYLYGSSETGEPYIVGKKLPGHDYSAWEAEYKNFPRLRSLTLESSEARTTYAWSFGGPKASTSFGSWELLLWVAVGILCALFLGYATRKFMSRFCHEKHDNKHEVLALPNSDIDVEHSILTDVWRRTLIKMYREQKSEILSLSELAVHYMNSNDNLRRLITKETKNKGTAKSALATLKAEHADEVAELQRQIDDLKRMLDDKSDGEKEPENTAGQETNENGEDVAGSEHPVVEAVVGCSSTNGPTEAESTTSQETIENAEDVVGSKVPLVDPALNGRTEAENTTSQEANENAEDVAGSSDPVVEAVVGCSSTNARTEAEDERAQATVETIEDVAGSVTPVVDPVIGGSSEQTRPPRIRANRRADGTIRTPSHPDYVPLEVSRSQQQLGDRPFNSSERGNTWGRGPGGRGRGRGRGGDRGGPFGWRGGRNRGGRWGGNVHDGQPNRGRGQ